MVLRWHIDLVVKRLVLSRALRGEWESERDRRRKGRCGSGGRAVVTTNEPGGEPSQRRGVNRNATKNKVTGNATDCFFS